MKKSYLTFLLSIGLVIGVNAQSEKEKDKQVVYNYSSSSTKSLQELRKLTKGNKDEYNTALSNIKKLESAGKIILSTKEYEPIKDRINSAPKYPSNPKEIEQRIYADEANKSYVVITDLLK